MLSAMYADEDCFLRASEWRVGRSEGLRMVGLALMMSDIIIDSYVSWMLIILVKYTDTVNY